MSNYQISVCTIYKESDYDYLYELGRSLPSCQWVLVKTIPTTQLGKEPHKIAEDVIEGNKVIEHWAYYYFQHTNGLTKFSFSDARNFAISKAKYEWVLSMDADDRLQYEQAQINVLKDLPKQVGGVYVNHASFAFTQPGERERNPRGYRYVNPMLRLFRNKFRFINTVHESIKESIIQKGYDILPSALWIIHTGYENQTTEDFIEKLKWYLSLIYKDLANDPMNGYLNEMAHRHLADLKRLGELDGNVYTG